MQTGMVCGRCTPRAGSRSGGGQRARQRQPGSKAGAGAARGRPGGALMAYVLRAGRGRDVANLTAGRDQAGG
jgi:hypothetical protein